MWRIWLQFDIRRVLVGLHVVLALLAFTIHFLLLSTDRYNWLDQASGAPIAAQSAQVELLDGPNLG